MQRARSDPFITDFLLRTLDFTSTRKEIIASTGLSPSTTSHILTRLVRENKIKRIARGVYQLIDKFKRITYSIRLVDTSTANPVHRWDGDIEIIVEGTVPIFVTSEQIEKALFTKAINETLVVLDEQDPPVLQIPDDSIIWDTINERGIKGIEDLGMAKGFEPLFNIEILFTNNVGARYKYDSVMKVNESDF